MESNSCHKAKGQTNVPSNFLKSVCT